MLLIAFAEFEEISVTFAIDGLVSFTTENKEVISFALVVRPSVRLVITDLPSEIWSNTLKQFVDKLPTNCLSVFDHFVKLALKGLRGLIYKIKNLSLHKIL